MTTGDTDFPKFSRLSKDLVDIVSLLFLQLINAVSTLDRNALNAMHQQLMDLRGCKGHKQCNPEKGELKVTKENMMDYSVSSNFSRRLMLPPLPFRRKGEKLLQ